MGTCYYYLVALTDNINVFKEFKKCLTDLVRLNAEITKLTVMGIPNVETWLMEMKRKYPGAFQMMNEELEFLKRQTNIKIQELYYAVPEIFPNYILSFTGSSIRLSSEAWHFTSWEGIARWFKRRGIPAAWTSEGYIDPLNYLEIMLYNSRNNLLKMLLKLLNSGKYEEAKALIISVLL